MKKRIAKMLRRAAQRLDPKETEWVVLTPTYGMSATNAAGKTYEWKTTCR